MSALPFTFAIAIFLIVDGFMLATGRRSLVDRLVPVSMKDVTRRWVSASVYFSIAAFMFVSVVRG